MSATTISKPAKQPRLSVMETRAFDYCEKLKQWNGGAINITWKKSSSYGHCPVVNNHLGEKIAYASGCGYDKLSAALSDALAFIGPDGERLLCHGHGVPSVIRKLAEWGWTLKQTANGDTFDSFSLERVKPETAEGTR